MKTEGVQCLPKMPCLQQQRQRQRQLQRLQQRQRQRQLQRLRQRQQQQQQQWQQQQQRQQQRQQQQLRLRQRLQLWRLLWLLLFALLLLFPLSAFATSDATSDASSIATSDATSVATSDVTSDATPDATSDASSIATSDASHIDMGSLEDGRSIYVGDIITLQITNVDFSAEELRDRFRAFEIVELKEAPGGYSLSLRTFEIGEHIVLLGDKEIIINVESLVEDIGVEDIFEGSGQVLESAFPFQWRAIFFAVCGVFVLSGGVAIAGVIIAKRKTALSPYRLFLKRSAALTIQGDDYFVDLTLCFKKYLESLYQFKIIGKTSTEIINDLKAIPQLDNMLPAIWEWLAECDRMKFTGVKVSIEIKEGHCIKLLELAERIHLLEGSHVESNTRKGIE